MTMSPTRTDAGPAAGTTTLRGTTERPRRRRLVVGFDRRPASRAALRWATVEAARTNADVLVVLAEPSAPRGPGRGPAAEPPALDALSAACDEVTTFTGGLVGCAALTGPGRGGQVLGAVARPDDLVVLGCDDGPHQATTGLCAAATQGLDRGHGVVLVGRRVPAVPVERYVTSSLWDPDGDVHAWLVAQAAHRRICVLTIGVADGTASGGGELQLVHDLFTGALRAGLDDPTAVEDLVVDTTWETGIRQHASGGDLVVLPGAAAEFVTPGALPCPVLLLPAPALPAPAPPAYA
ncbi:hypothetical protein ACIB24_09925 [Spongisporangium articulatum]|uniref:Universal stress protein family protein n=1 Tax=Spongisporangium articulatum TaxID=3362603 RepID=A0ABW8ALY1_9ACTN